MALILITRKLASLTLKGEGRVEEFAAATA